MKRSVRGIAMFFFSAVAVVIGSCHFKKEYPAEIKELDSLNAVVTDCQARLSDHDDWAALQDSIRYLLFIVQESQPRNLSLEKIALLNDMGRMRLEMESMVAVKAQLALKLDSSAGQLNKLKQALDEGATHDSNDNKIDNTYVMNALKNEKAIVEMLSARFLEIEQAQAKLKKTHIQLAPQLKLLADSIAEKHQLK
jgi:hypothetical protein